MAIYQLSQPKLKKPLPQQVSAGISVIAAGGPRTGVVQVPQNVTFYAPLTINTQDYASKVQQTFTRNSVAVYDRAGQLRPVNINASRHERYGLLMEPVGTNKCTNYNAAPQTDNMVKNGDPAAVFTIVDDSEELAKVGLLQVCPAGLAYKLDNTAGASFAFLQVLGVAGNTNLHQAHAYARRDVGTVFIQISGAGGASTQVVAADYAHYVAAGNPPGVSDRFQLGCDAGGVGYFVLNQFEEGDHPTSVIITEGAEANRGVDQAQWSLTDAQGQNILNQAEGTAAVIVRFGFDFADTVAGTQHGFISSRDGPVSLLYHNNVTGTVSQLVSRDDVGNFATVDFAASKPSVDEIYVLAVQWSGSAFKTSYKMNGVWTRGTPGTYGGNFTAETALHLAYDTKHSSHYRDLYLWNTEQSDSELEAIFAEVAN